MPYIPVCVYDRPPPLVLIGSDPPGVDFPFSKNETPSPGFAKPIDSSMIGGPEVNASYSMRWSKSPWLTPAIFIARSPDMRVALLNGRPCICVTDTCSVASPVPRT